jgi:hypothetical protein
LLTTRPSAGHFECEKPLISAIQVTSADHNYIPLNRHVYTATFPPSCTLPPLQRTKPTLPAQPPLLTSTRSLRLAPFK